MGDARLGGASTPRRCDGGGHATPALAPPRRARRGRCRCRRPFWFLYRRNAGELHTRLVSAPPAYRPCSRGKPQRQYSRQQGGQRPPRPPPAGDHHATTHHSCYSCALSESSYASWEPAPASGGAPLPPPMPPAAGTVPPTPPLPPPLAPLPPPPHQPRVSQWPPTPIVLSQKPHAIRPSSARWSVVVRCGQAGRAGWKRTRRQRWRSWS